MKAAVPALAPLLRSNAQGDLLALLLLDPESEHSLSDIVRIIGALPATVHREVERLVASGVLLDRAVGRSRLVRANRENEFYGPLSDLLLLSYGPRALLPKLIGGVDGVESAYIYGSWAARYRGESGPPPRDVDVVVVGSASRSALQATAREAERMLHREVNISRVSAEEWQKADSPFVATVRARPLVELTRAH